MVWNLIFLFISSHQIFGDNKLFAHLNLAWAYLKFLGLATNYNMPKFSPL